MNSFIPWVGGKSKLLWIINKMAPDHYSRFIDVFGGSGTVTMSRPIQQGCMEVYNDFNSNLTNLFCCVKNRPLHSEIISQIRCICGARMRFKNVNSKWYLCCTNHDAKGDCLITPIRETQIYESFCRLYYKLKHQSIPILEQMLTNLQMIRNRRMLWSPDIVALNKRISDLSSQNQTLAFLKQQGLVDPDIFIAKTNELTKQLRQVKLEKEKLMDAESDMTALQTRDLIDLLEGGPEFLDSFDTELFGELVEKIIIEGNDSVRFCLKNGLELRESIERTVR